MFSGSRHVIRSEQFYRSWLEQELFPLVYEMEKIVSQGGCDLLRNKRMVSLFYEASTRTKMSFEFAMDYLGGRVVSGTENARVFSSAGKGKNGETLAHTLKVINRYRPNVIVLRYDRELKSEEIDKISDAPVINAGDRGEDSQHPTQALLDLFTIKKKFGLIDGLTITIMGDLEKGRTSRSLAYMLGKFDGIKMNFVSPKDTMMNKGVKDYLHRHQVPFRELTDVREVAGDCDVIYQTRTQVECGSSIDRDDLNNGYFLVNQEILDMMKKDAIVMHPLPNDGEITAEVDSDPRAVYLTHQIDSGLYVRMALLKMILEPSPFKKY